MWQGIVNKVTDEDFGSSVTIGDITFQSDSKSWIEGEVYQVETDGSAIIKHEHQPFEFIQGCASMVNVYGETCSFYVNDRHFVAHGHLINGNQYKLHVVGKTVYKFEKVTI